MSIKSLISEVWSARLLYVLKNKTIFENLVNTDYQGEIKRAGNTVKIFCLGKPTIQKLGSDRELTINKDFDVVQTSLIVDQEDAFGFEVHDIDEVQTVPNLVDNLVTMHADGLAQSADKFIAKEIVDSAGITIGSDDNPIVSNSTNMYDVLVAIHETFEKNNVPQSGRFIVAPPEVVSLLQLDPRIVNTAGIGGENRMITGKISTLFCISIYSSNNIPKTTGGNFNIIASCRDAITYVSQISQMELARKEKGFADIVKGLHVYGGKVTYPSAVIKAIVKIENNLVGTIVNRKINKVK